MKKTLFTLVTLALPALCQTTIKDSLVKHWKTSGDFTLAVAKAMPAENYSFRPAPEEMSFGQLMIHIGSANAAACALASGTPRPAMPQNISSAAKDVNYKIERDAIIQYLSDTFKFCDDAVASMTPEKLDAVVGTSRKMTGFEWLWSYFTHTAHHRGQAEVYLRVKGIKPPDYAF